MLLEKTCDNVVAWAKAVFPAAKLFFEIHSVTHDTHHKDVLYLLVFQAPVLHMKRDICIEIKSYNIAESDNWYHSHVWYNYQSMNNIEIIYYTPQKERTIQLNYSFKEPKKKEIEQFNVVYHTSVAIYKQCSPQ